MLSRELSTALAHRPGLVSPDGAGAGSSTRCSATRRTSSDLSRLDDQLVLGTSRARLSVVELGTLKLRLAARATRREGQPRRARAPPGSPGYVFDASGAHRQGSDTCDVQESHRPRVRQVQRSGQRSARPIDGSTRLRSSSPSTRPYLRALRTRVAGADDELRRRSPAQPALRRSLRLRAAPAERRVRARPGTGNECSCSAYWRPEDAKVFIAHTNS